ncbi:MAG: hypothetical protein A3E79_18735 [Burkholderiales bacterium RIFCSPHIGHO2_12_FULL_61_11]|nr:MAG: hypothetical protein A3E79_18735 [Burkholderiales bacterium RIFCSPHIGHO2_12_FULL_61_11]
MTKPNIGWIGLGKMGLPMAAHIVAAGYPVAVFNRSPEKAKPLVEQGARCIERVQELARESDIVFSMVADDHALLDIATGEAGALEALRPGTVFVDMSTVSPSASERVAVVARSKGIRYLRAPVSGSTAMAVAAGLTVLVSGPSDAYQEVEALFRAIGKKIYYLGAEEQARYMKLSINMMLGITAAMMSEAMVLSERVGVDWHQMIEVINNSAVASPLVGYKAKMLSERDFTPMFTTSQMAKDFDLALDAARSLNVPLPITALTRQFLGAMVASGRGESDFFSYVTLLEEIAGIAGSSTPNIKKD